jgi:NAD(P)H-dependent FMN reductase
MTPRVGVVVGSTRPTRICGAVTDWAIEQLRAGGGLVYEVIDLATLDLPFLDEPLPAALGVYQHDHTKAWSRLVSSYEAFVFVFPQYNWGYPAPLKNALDFLYAEWAGKPAGLVTYGTRGGAKAAEQLRGVLAGLHMHTVDAAVELRIGRGDVDDHGQLVDVAATLAPSGGEVAQLHRQLADALAPATERAG